MRNNELNNVKDALRQIANQLDVMTQTSGTPQASQATSQGMPLQIGYLLCFAGTIFFSIRTDWFFLLVINFSELEPARISCHTVAIKNLLKNYNNNKNERDKTNERFL